LPGVWSVARAPDSWLIKAIKVESVDITSQTTLRKKDDMFFLESQYPVAIEPQPLMLTAACLFATQYMQPA
jgi:hypothetical protein